MTVLLVADISGGELNEDSTAKALTAATQLGDVHAVCATTDAQAAAETMASLQGVDKVFSVSGEQYQHALAEPMADLIVSMASDYDHILFASTTSGKNIAPRVAALLDVMVLTDVMEVKGSDEFVRPIYAGNAIQTVKSSDAKKVMTIRTANFDAAEAVNSASIETREPLDSKMPTQWVSNEIQESDRPDLTSAKIVVSGGRGVGSEENFEMIINLADKLEGAVGASRAAVDAGYAPNDWQVGQTGKIVAPDLYIAIGISGAIQHLAGMKDAKIIAAINKDEDAPIFQVADYGLVADLFEALPEIDKSLS